MYLASVFSLDSTRLIHSHAHTKERNMSSLPPLALPLLSTVVRGLSLALRHTGTPIPISPPAPRFAIKGGVFCFTPASQMSCEGFELAHTFATAFALRARANVLPPCFLAPENGWLIRAVGK